MIKNKLILPTITLTVELNNKIIRTKEHINKWEIRVLIMRQYLKVAEQKRLFNLISFRDSIRLIKKTVVDFNIYSQYYVVFQNI